MSNKKLPVQFMKGKQNNLPNGGEPNTLYFAEDTGNLYKSSRNNGELIPYSGVVGIFETLEDLELAIRIEGKLYILNDEGVYSVYIYDSEKGFIPITAQADGSDLNISQKTKLNITASKEEPYQLSIPIEYTADFKKPPIEVLRMEGQDQEEVTDILADFDNADRDDFEPNEFVEMDGTMRIRTNWEVECDTISESDGFYSFDMAWLDKLDVLEGFDIR